MRSLFLKIFLFFLVAMVLVGAVLVALALTSDPRRAELSRHRKEIERHGRELIAAYEAGGANLLRERSEELAGAVRHRVFLFRGGRGPLSGRPMPPRKRLMVEEVAQSGEIQLRPGRRGWWVAWPLKEDYVLLVEAKPPGKLERLLDPHRLTLRLLVAFVIGGVICYLLARSLTAPIHKLRQATRQFAGGDLQTRVSDTVPGRDEIAGLARDFDGMAEHIEELVGSQKRLLRDISHELRSPLARLNVALELARQRSGDEAQNALSRIEQESERLNEMIGQLLSLTLLESRVKPLQKTDIDLGALVHGVVQDADFEARGRDRSVAMARGEGVHIDGAEELLRRAIENVIRNGVRYTAEGSAVEVGLGWRESAVGRQAVITVRDHGPGVPEEDLKRIFQPFYRVADARDRQSGGTGIGLAISERAVRLHGGEITAKNAGTGGLCIEITLPT